MASKESEEKSNDSQKSRKEEKRGIKIMIMNASGPNDGEGTAGRRKKCVSDIIQNLHPELVLFQEFSWTGITGSTWKKTPIPDEYELNGHKDASILYDTIKIKATSPSPSTVAERLLDEMLRKGDLPGGFTPLSRMCLRFVETVTEPVIKFICISWHGRYKGLKESTLVEELENLLIFLKRFCAMFMLPLVLAGDFNLRYEVVKEHVTRPFVAHEYTPLKRRLGSVIDFYITSGDLVLDHIQPIDLETETEAVRPLRVLDHDPVCAVLALPASTKSAPKEALGATGRKAADQKNKTKTVRKTVEKTMKMPRAQ